jgi:feruloyl esterase
LIAGSERTASILAWVHLRGFKAHGGKMIQYAGWADAAIPPENRLNYYRKVTHTIGDPSDFYRVFMVPGMAHCSGGAGPNAFGNGTVNGPKSTRTTTS